MRLADRADVPTFADAPVAAAVVSRMRPVELWIPAAITLFIGLRWLLAERHSAFGDEFFHLTNLWNAIANARGGLINGFVDLYVFNFAYPPVFHLISAPFVLFSADPILAGRVYAQVLTLFVALLLYTVAREVGGKLAGAVAVATLLGTPSFVDVSRHYMLEPLLMLEVLAVLYAIGRYYHSRRLRYVLLIAGLVSAGLLTKFNFFFYAAPLFIVPAAIELYRVARGRQHWSAVLLNAGVVVSIPLLLAGPWYMARATGPMSATGMLNTLYEAGTLKAGLTFDALFEQTFAPLSWNYSGLMQLLALMAAVIYSGSLMGIRVLRSLVGPLSLRQHVLLSSAFVSAVCVPVLLGLVGLGGTLRWHVEAACVFVATFGLLGRLRPAPRIVSISAAAAGAALQLATIYVTPVGAPALLRVPDSGITPRPSAVPIGSETLARDIARHEKRIGGTKPGEFAYFLYHEHAGPHYGTVEFYLRFEGAPLWGRIAGFNNRAIELENIFGAKYLVDEVGGNAGEWEDPENQRYRRLAANLPTAFQQLLVEVSDVEGRHGRFKVYYVPRERITLDMVLSTIEIGRKLETVEPFLILWDAQRVIWRAKFEPLTGNDSLRQEIDGLLPRTLDAERQLSTLNRQLLQGYLSKIQDIRQRIGDVQRRTASSSVYPATRASS